MVRLILQRFWEENQQQFLVVVSVLLFRFQHVVANFYIKKGSLTENTRTFRQCTHVHHAFKIFLLFEEELCFFKADSITILLIDSFWVLFILLDSRLNANIKLCF